MTGSAGLSNLVSWSLQVLLIVGAGGALPWLFGLRTPAVRHGYWRALLLLCLTLPVLQPWRPAPAADAGTDLLLAATGHAAPTAPAPTAFPIPMGSRAEAAGAGTAAVGILIAAVALVRLVRLAAALLRLRQLRRAGVPAGSGHDLSDVAAFRGVRADVRYVQDLRQPVTFGLLEPIVLLPRSLSSKPPEIQRAVIVHEMWHVRRHDWLWVLVEEAVRAVLWFHPAIGWLVRQVQSSREEVVDELTVLATNGRRSYLEALLAFADEPRFYPAAPFARRRHLFQRMLLISTEAVMSSRRIVASCAAMGGVVILGTWVGVQAFPLTDFASRLLQEQPRDRRLRQPRPPSTREKEIADLLRTTPSTAGLYIELAKLQEDRGAPAEAEATLGAAHGILPNDGTLAMALAGLYQRNARFAEAMEVMEQVAAGRPDDPQAQHLAAAFYEERVRKDASLPQDIRSRFLEAGIAAEDRALALRADYMEALIVKNLLLRHQAALESNPVRQAQLIAEADQLRAQALEMQRSRRSSGASTQGQGSDARSASVARPAQPVSLVDGQAPIRVGGNMQPPLKIKNVPPLYPPEALAQQVTGVVIIEATIDSAGLVRDTRVLRSIQMLDEAAVDAVRQWEFEPTMMNGAPVPVVMTVTVNFTLQ